MRISIVLLLHVVLTGVVQSTTVLSLGTSHDLITTDQTECTGSLHDLHENDAEVWSEVLHPKPFYRFFLYKRAVTQWTEVVPKNVQTRPPRDMNRAKHHPRLGFRLVRYYQFPVFDAAKIEALGEGRPKPSYHEFPMNKRFDMMRPVPETPERLQAQQEDDDLLAELVKVTPLPAQCMYRGEDLAAPHDIPSLPYDRALLSTEDYTYTAAQSRRFEVSTKDYQNECTPLSDPAGPRLCVFNLEFEILFRRYPVDSEIQEWLQLTNNLGSTSKEEFLQHYTTSVFAHQRVVFSLSGDDPNSVGTDPGSKSHVKKEDSLESFERDVESERAAYKDAFIIADVETLIKRRQNLKMYQYFTHRAHLKAAVPVGNSASSQPDDPIYLYLTVVFRSLDFRLIHLLKLNLQFLKASTFFPSGWLDIDVRPLEEVKRKFEILQSESVTHPEQVHNIMVPVRKKYERYNQLLPNLVHQFIARIVENSDDMPPVLNHPRMRQLRMKLIVAQSQKCTLHVRAIIFLVGYATYFTIHVVTTNGAFTLQEDVFAVRSGAAKSEGVIQAIAYSVEVPEQGGYTHSVFFRFETERPIFLIYPHAFLLENITKREVQADNLKLEVQSIVEQLGTQLTDPITEDIIVHPFESKKHRVTNISPLLKIEYPIPKRQGGHLAARVLSQVPEKQTTMYHYYLVQHHHHHHHHFHTKYLTRNYIWSHVPDRKASTSPAGWYVILITSIVTFVNVMCGTLFIILHSKRSVRAR